MITTCSKVTSRTLIAIGGTCSGVVLAILFATLGGQAAAEGPFHQRSRSAATGSAGNGRGQEPFHASLAVETRGATTIGPICAPDDQLFDLHGNPVVFTAAGSVATPIGTTYSVHHLIGADWDNDGLTNCLFINQEPPTGAPDDIVTYDGLPEAIRTDVLGTIPIVMEGKTDNANTTHVLEVFASSPSGTELFPGGFVSNGSQLTDACFFVGLQDPLNWEGLDTVTLAAITFLKDGGVVAGPLDVTSRFANPWNGLFSVVLLNGAGADINGVQLEILVEKTPPNPLGACCVGGECIGDVMEVSCSFQGGTWHFGASCGQNPNLPSPVCDQATCSFDNGLPLDDRGTPASQYAPDQRFADAAADDLTLSATGTDPCRINQVRVWTTHPDAARAVNPSIDYDAVNVTVYANAALTGPAGQPEQDGTHSADYFGGIRYGQTIPMSAITATCLTPGNCTGDGLWQLDIPVHIVLAKDAAYWVEVQPIMDFGALGRVALLLSNAANEHPAQRISPRLGVTQWQEIGGNAGACPAGNPPTPPAGTHKDIAFQASGEEYVTVPPNDTCADAATVGDGVVSFSNLRAGTDGPDEPEMCNFYQYTQVESDVWFEYRATCTGSVTASLCGSSPDYDTKLAVYGGCGYCPPRGVPVACNEDAQMVCGLQSEVTFPTVQGNCYTIRVGGYRGDQGYGVMTIRCEEPPPPQGACCNGDGVCVGTMSEADCATAGGTWFAGGNCATFSCPVYPPPNDECSQYIPVFTEVRYDGKTNHATGTDISSCAGGDTADVWHRWTADCNGLATFNLCNSSFDTTLSVFDACGGRQLACNDDDCGTRSRTSLTVTTGSTYSIRVAGFNHAVGDYSLIVEDCAVACCRPDGTYCALRKPAVCTSVGGISRGPGTVCLGDHNGNRIDDACEACAPAQIVGAEPLDGTVDAREPYVPSIPLPRLGIGSPGPGSDREPIVITLNPPILGAEDCFRLCETVPDPLLGANSISDVTYLGNAAYEIVLHHAITAGGVTTIKYLGGGFVTYTSHPANVDGDSASGPVDILAIIDILNQASPAPWGDYSCDADRSGVCGPADILRVIDLLNGADFFEPWLGQPLPANTSCP